ncbi:sulfatase, partial [bacterium]|nr:sulfatase [bacterium]
MMIRRILSGILIVTIICIGVWMFLNDQKPCVPTDYYDFASEIDQAEFVWKETKEFETKTLIFSENFETESSNKWMKSVTQGKAECSRSSLTSHSGKFSYSLKSLPENENGSGAEAEAFAVIPVEGNTRYGFEVFVLVKEIEASESRVACSYYIGEYHDEGELQGNFIIAPSFHVDDRNNRKKTKDWQRKAYSFKTRRSTKFLKISLCLGSWGKTRGHVLFDDISLWKLADSDSWSFGEVQPEVGMHKVQNEVRRSIAVPVPSKLKYDVIVPKTADLSLAIGVPMIFEESSRRAVEFEITARESLLKTHSLLKETIQPGKEWTNFSLDLSQFQGEKITIQLSVKSSAVKSDKDLLLPEKIFWAHPVMQNKSKLPDKKSVLWISIDTLRADHVGNFGYPESTTPNLDRLASRGITFSQAYTVSSWTLPSHASLFTGTFPAFHKTDNKTTLNKNIPTAAEMFTDAGYVCGAFSTHLYVSEIFGLERGFQTLWCKQDARAAEVIERAISWLNLHHTEPVFLFLHFFDPHWDYEPPKPYDKMFDPDYSGT